MQGIQMSTLLFKMSQVREQKLQEEAGESELLVEMLAADEAGVVDRTNLPTNAAEEMVE